MVKFLNELQQGGKAGRQAGSNLSPAFRKGENLDAKSTHSNWGIMQWVVPLTLDRSNVPFHSSVQVCSKQLQ